MGVFISYAWEDTAEKLWVKNLAARLRGDGIESILDVWETKPGDEFTKFMETSVRESEYVLIICTPEYKKRADQRQKGVGYETRLITAEILYMNKDKKFIPILRCGEYKDAVPSYLHGIFYIDLQDGEKYEDEYQNLLNTLHGKRPQAPPVSALPHKKPDEFKLNFILDRLMGRAWSTGHGIKYEDGVLINEGDIVSILTELKKYAHYIGDEYWLNILHSSDITTAIDSHIWKNGEIVYSYDEAERREIINRCVKRIKFRLSSYTGTGHIQYKIMDDGNIGFRYI